MDQIAATAVVRYGKRRPKVGVGQLRAFPTDRFGALEFSAQVAVRAPRFDEDQQSLAANLDTTAQLDVQVDDHAAGRSKAGSR